jgi:hypothetical protein
MHSAGICAGPGEEGFAEHKALDENEDLAGKEWAEIDQVPSPIPLGAICQPALFDLSKLPGTNGRLGRWGNSRPPISPSPCSAGYLGRSRQIGSATPPSFLAKAMCGAFGNVRGVVRRNL